MKAFQTLTDGILVRMGTFITATLLGYGIHADHVAIVVPAVLVLCGVGVDMLVGSFVKNRGH